MSGLLYPLLGGPTAERVFLVRNLRPAISRFVDLSPRLTWCPAYGFLILRNFLFPDTDEGGGTLTILLCSADLEAVLGAAVFRFLPLAEYSALLVAVLVAGCL